MVALKSSVVRKVPNMEDAKARSRLPRFVHLSCVSIPIVDTAELRYFAILPLVPSSLCRVTWLSFSICRKGRWGPPVTQGSATGPLEIVSRRQAPFGCTTVRLYARHYTKRRRWSRHRRCNQRRCEVPGLRIARKVSWHLVRYSGAYVHLDMLSCCQHM